MHDAHDRIIYVGKAKNLRQRIGSYRYVCHEDSPKTARLLAHVANIRWRECDSEEAALLEENRLLRELRPRFNRMNTWPKALRFVTVQCDATSFRLGLAIEPTDECYGAFKGASREAFGALLRLLWAGDESYAALPRPLLLEHVPAVYEFPMARALNWMEELRGFLRGDCDALMGRFANSRADNCRFNTAFRQADFLALEHFSRIGPQRNRMLRTQFKARDFIAQHELDDLLVRHRQIVHRATRQYSPGH